MLTTDPFDDADDATFARVREAFANWPYRAVHGISKDGRPMYTINYDNGQEY